MENRGKKRHRISAEGFIADQSKFDNLELRELSSYPFQPKPPHPIPLDFQIFFDAKVGPLLDVGGYKVAAKRELLTSMAHALVITAQREECVADSANTGEAGVKLRVKLWAKLVEAGLAIRCCGSELSGKVTRYGARKKLLRLHEWHLQDLVDTTLHRNSELAQPTSLGLVCQHSGRIDLASGEQLDRDDAKKPMTFQDCDRAGLDVVRTLEDEVEAFNSNNLDHNWKCEAIGIDGRKTTSPLNPCVRYLHIGRFLRYARFYSWSRISGQKLSAAQRATILIDKEPVAELDFSASILRIQYHSQKLDPAGDLYCPERVFTKSYLTATQAERQALREFVKRATLICLNVNSKDKATRAIHKRIFASDQAAFLQQAIFKIEKIKAEQLVKRIVKAHHELTRETTSGPFFTNAGEWLISIESLVMRAIMRRFVEAEKPMLPVHDSLVCKVSDVDFARIAMIESYQSVLGTDFLPVISRKF